MIYASPVKAIVPLFQTSPNLSMQLLVLYRC